MNSGGTGQKPKIARTGGSKLPLIIGGAVIAIIIIVVIIANLGGSSATPRLLSIAQQQTEISRVAALNFENLTTSSAKNFAINTNLTMLSTQSSYLKFLASNGSGVDPKDLTTTKNSQTDTLLSAAAENGTLDSATKTELVNELTKYQQTLKTAYDESTSTVAKTEYKLLFDEAALLIEQSTH